MCAHGIEARNVFFSPHTKKLERKKFRFFSWSLFFLKLKTGILGKYQNFHWFEVSILRTFSLKSSIDFKINSLDALVLPNRFLNITECIWGLRNTFLASKNAFWSSNLWFRSDPDLVRDTLHVVRIRLMKRSEARRDESQTSRVQGNYACTKCSCQAEPSLPGMNST